METAKKKEQVNQQNAERKLHIEIVTKMTDLATAGFGLVAALAWNEVIQKLVRDYIEPNIPGSGLFSRLLYAVVITVIAVFITLWLSKLGNQLKGQNKS